MGGGWGEGSGTEQSQSEPTPNLERGDGGGREERPERVERGRKKGAEWMWNKLILQPHNKKDEW